MALPLDGVKVVDLARVFFGPGTAMYLADQGADVVKVESMEGESGRYKFSSPYLQKRGFSKAFLALNRNKRGISLDMRTADGQGILHRLARWADVFILNFPPGGEAKVSLGYEALAAINPRLIYVSVTAFGNQGPDASLPGYDIVLQAQSGILSTARNSDGQPIPSVVRMGDMSGSMALAYAVMLALWQRERTGKGQRVDTSILNAALAIQLEKLIWVEGDDSPPAGQEPSALYNTYRCRDNQWLAIVVMEEHQWRRLCPVLGLDHLADSPEFATFRSRMERAIELYEILQAVFETRPCDEWVRAMKLARVPCSKVVNRQDVPKDPQAIANQMFVEQDHPVVGKVTTVAPPFQLSGSRDERWLRLPTPALGQHTAEILRELGYDDAAISSYTQRAIVR